MWPWHHSFYLMQYCCASVIIVPPQALLPNLLCWMQAELEVLSESERQMYERQLQDNCQRIESLESEIEMLHSTDEARKNEIAALGMHSGLPIKPRGRWPCLRWVCKPLKDTLRHSHAGMFWRLNILPAHAWRAAGHSIYHRIITISNLWYGLGKRPCGRTLEKP